MDKSGKIIKDIAVFLKAGEYGKYGVASVVPDKEGTTAVDIAVKDEKGTLEIYRIAVIRQDSTR